MPGGVHTSGLQGSANTGVGGIHTELMERFAAAGYIYTATQDTLPDWAGNPLSHYERYHKPDAPFTRASFNPEGAGSVMATMLKEAGVTALYGTSFVDAIVEGRHRRRHHHRNHRRECIRPAGYHRQDFHRRLRHGASRRRRGRAVRARRRTAAGDRRLGRRAASDSRRTSLDHERHRFQAHRRTPEIRQRSARSRS